MASTRSHIAKLKKLFFARTLDDLRSGVHLARSLGDASVIDALLEGASYDAETGIVSPGRVFYTQPQKARHHARVATLGLIATGAGDRAKALRDQIAFVHLSGRYETRHKRSLRHNNDPNTPVDLALLCGLSLRRLGVENVELQNEELLGEFEALEVLRIPRVTPEVLARLTRLRELQANIEGRVPTLPVCEKLQIRGEGKLVVEHMPQLREFQAWSSYAQVRFVSAPQLAKLTLDRVDELATDEPLPALVGMDVGSAILQPEKFVALERLACSRSLVGVTELPKLKRLVVRARRTSLAELGGMELEYFEAQDHDLKTLEGHPRAPGPAHRWFTRLSSFEGIGCIGDIEMLTVGRATTRLDGLEELDTLRGIDLRDCKSLEDVSALAGLDVRVILIAGTKLRRSDFPDDVRWAIVAERDLPADFEILARRVRENVTSETSEEVGILDELEPLLREPTFESLNQAADRVRKAADPKLTDHLLERVSVRKDVVPGPNTGKSSKKTLGVRRHFVRRLLAEAPAGSEAAAKIKARIKSLELTEVRKRRHANCPIVLGPLAAFPKLRSLELEARRITAKELAPLRDCKLERISLRYTDAEDFSWLAAKDLRSVEIRGEIRSLDGLQDAEHLAELFSSGTLESLEPLRDKRDLHSLELSVRPGTDLSPLGTLRGLRKLTLSAAECDFSVLEKCPGLEDAQLGGVSGPLPLPGARVAHINGTFRSLAEFRAPKLETLKVFTEDEMESIDATGLDALRELHLSCRSLATIGTLPETLQVLSLSMKQSCTIDLEKLAVLPALRVLDLRRVQVETFQWAHDFPALRALAVRSAEVTDLSELKRVETLEGLYLERTDKALRLDPLVEHATLKRIAVSPRKNIIALASLPEAFREKLVGSSYMGSTHLSASDYLD